MSENWPNFFIVGAYKSGTTSLYEYLNEMPEIYMSPVKEPNFFSSKTVPHNFFLKPIRVKQEYLTLFKNVKNEKIIGEASPSYLADPDAPNLIHQVSPQARIIIILRDPVDRLYSHYLMHIRDGRLKLSLHEVIQKWFSNDIDYCQAHVDLSIGLFYKQVSRYLDIFGPSQVKIIIFEEFKNNPEKTLKDILEFLGLKNKINNFSTETYNPYFVDRGVIAQRIRTSSTLEKIIKKTIPQTKRLAIRKKFFIKKGEKPKIFPKDKDELIKFYGDDVKKLEGLLGRKLPWKNFHNS